MAIPDNQATTQDREKRMARAGQAGMLPDLLALAMRHAQDDVAAGQVPKQPAKPASDLADGQDGAIEQARPLQPSVVCRLASNISLVLPAPITLGN